MIQAKSLHCPNCGGAVELRGFAHTLSVVCPSCLTVLDATSPLLTILQTFQGQQRIQPEIPLGTRGTFNGTPFEVIGFEVREVGIEDERYAWAEYLLFNPYKGFRYLSEHQGHWNFTRVLSSLPDPPFDQTSRTVRFEGRSYRHFDRAQARTSYVLGEFPWKVSVGDTVQVSDYTSPPLLLSAETTGVETTWSLGEYYTGAQIWQALKLSGKPGPAVGPYMNQPSPFAGKVASVWRTWVWMMVALAALWFFFTVRAGRQQVFSQKYAFAPGASTEPSFVTADFDVGGRDSNLEIRINTDLRQDWVYFNFVLVNVTTEKARDFGREVSYYGDEGSPRDRVILPAVPPGRYYLRVEPEKAPGSGPVNYEIVIRRDVPTYGWLLLAAFLLLIPPLVVSIRSSSFESARWRESDYPAKAGGE